MLLRAGFDSIAAMTLRSALLLTAFACTATFAPARTLIHCGTLIDGMDDAPRKEITVVVDGERIVAV